MKAFEFEPGSFSSVPDSEWQETQNKARAVLRAAEMVLAGLDAELHR